MPPGMPPMGPPPGPPQPTSIPLDQAVPSSQVAQMMSEARSILQQVVMTADPASEVADSISGIVRELDAIIARNSGMESPSPTPRRANSDMPPPKRMSGRGSMLPVDESGVMVSPTNTFPMGIV